MPQKTELGFKMGIFKDGGFNGAKTDVLKCHSKGQKVVKMQD